VLLLQLMQHEQDIHVPHIQSHTHTHTHTHTHSLTQADNTDVACFNIKVAMVGPFRKLNCLVCTVGLSRTVSTGHVGRAHTRHCNSADSR